jgi:hypothetical protein
VTAYDPEERIHPPAHSFLSREPSHGERRRLRRLLAAMPAPPELVFWPESAAIDGPWSVAPDGYGAARPVAPDGYGAARPVAPDGNSTARPVAPDGNSTARPVAPDGNSTARPLAAVGAGAVHPAAPSLSDMRRTGHRTSASVRRR